MVSHPSRHDASSSNLARKQSLVNLTVGTQGSAGPSGSGSRLMRAQSPSIEEKILCFRERELVMCPATPPLAEMSDFTEEELLRQSQARIEAMAQRLAQVPLSQARCMINLACTQLKGPFSEGCRYWGTAVPVVTASTDISLNNSGPVPGSSRAGSARNLPPPKAPNPPALPFPLLPPAPVLPATPNVSRSVDIDLLSIKASIGRPLLPPDSEILEAARSPSPTPLLPRPSSQLPRSSQSLRSSQLPGFPQPPESSQLPPPSRTSRSSLGLRPPYPRTTPNPTSNVAPPETPRLQLSQPLVEHSPRELTSVIRRPSKLSPRGPQIFPPITQADPFEERGSPSPSREASPLLRFSQRESSSQKQSSSPRRRLPRFSPGKFLSEQRSSDEDDFFSSQVNVNQRLEDITRFMGDDVAS